MAESLIDGTGSGFRAGVNASNRLLVQTEGISVGSLTVDAGSVVTEKSLQQVIRNNSVGIMKNGLGN